MSPGSHWFLKMKGLILSSGFFLSLSACVTHKDFETEKPAKTYLQSELNPSAVLILSEQFLEWQKGYPLKVKDQERGLLVTEWIQEELDLRQRVTVRVTQDAQGSLLSGHIETEEANGGQWIALPSDPRREERLIKELDAFLQKSPAVTQQK